MTYKFEKFLSPVEVTIRNPEREYLNSPYTVEDCPVGFLTREEKEGDIPCSIFLMVLQKRTCGSYYAPPISLIGLHNDNVKSATQARKFVRGVKKVFKDMNANIKYSWEKLASSKRKLLKTTGPECTITAQDLAVKVGANPEICTGLPVFQIDEKHQNDPSSLQSEINHNLKYYNINGCKKRDMSQAYFWSFSTYGKKPSFTATFWVVNDDTFKQAMKDAYKVAFEAFHQIKGLTLLDVLKDKKTVALVSQESERNNLISWCHCDDDRDDPRTEYGLSAVLTLHNPKWNNLLIPLKFDLINVESTFAGGGVVVDAWHGTWNQLVWHADSKYFSERIRKLSPCHHWNIPEYPTTRNDFGVVRDEFKLFKNPNDRKEVNKVFDLMYVKWKELNGIS